MTDKPLPFPRSTEAPAVAVAPLPEGTQVAHLRIERVLNESAHAIVYLTRDDAGGAIALMEYFPRALALRQPDGSVRARQAGDAIAMSVAREGFVQDANTLQSIRHPGLVPLLGSLQANRTVYRAMPYIDGPTLERQVRERDGPATVGEVTRLLDGLLDALDALHKAGVVHGAVRPDQVLIAPDGQPVLLGMGSAGAELAGHEPGPWSAPEQAAMSRHDRINSATDLYMVALTAWFAATGVPPPPLSDRLANPHDWDPAVALAQLPEGEGDSGPTLDNLAIAINAALALLPADRPQRVADLRALLHPAQAHASFEPSGTAPLWVGVVPDRESQWEVLDGRGVPPSPDPTQPTALPERAPAPPIDDARLAAPVPRPRALPAVPSRWARWIVPALLLIGGMAAVAWWGVRREERMAVPPTTTHAFPAPVAAPTLPLPQAAPTVPLPPVPAASPVQPNAAPIAAAAPASPRRVEPAPPKRSSASGGATASPQALCGGRTQFSLLYCLQEQCAKPTWRNHAQCNELRRRGDIR
jgi:serine/threonine protein kinase